MGHGWEVVERYISGQKEKIEARQGRRDRYSYEETSAMPVVLIDVERGKTHKTGYISLYTKLFKGVVCTSQK